MPNLYGNDNDNVSSSSNKEHSEGNDSRIIGPALPPHLLNRTNNPNISSSSIDDNSQEMLPDAIGPSLPSSNLLNRADSSSNADCTSIGPILPPHLSNKADSTESSSAAIGPTFPPHLNKADSTTNVSEMQSTVIGPPLPAQEGETSAELPDSSSSTYGPSLPPYLQKSAPESSDDEDEYGPLPPGASTSSTAHQALEERALQIKLGYFGTNESKAAVREEWMMELPEVKSGSLGLGPRQFRKNERPDFSDRSSWTDTPEQKKIKKVQDGSAEKIDLKKEAQLKEISKRDDEQRKLAEKHNKKKKRDKSLMEMHQDELRKKKKQNEQEGTVTRRPFNRDIDLKVNQFDDAQKKSIMKKAMHLDDRFSRGQSEFL